MTTIERLQKYFKENDEWHDNNWTTPGNENPYPRKIQSAFIRYLMMKYTVTVTYYNAMGKRVSEIADEDTLWNSTSHAWFDCLDLDDCIDLMECWVRDFYEQYYSAEEFDDKVEISIELRQTKK